MMSSSNQRPANRGFRSVFRCAIPHYRQSPSLSAPEPGTPGVRLVYIDPPFSTKQDRQGNADEKAYQDKIAGGRFLEFLRKRLLVLRELLADDGSIYVHLDWRTIHYVKVLCDEIFSERRFLNEAVWFYRRWSSGSDQFQRQHETLLIYSKGNSPVFNVLYEPYTEGTLKRWKGIKRKSVMADDGKLIQIQDTEGTEGANMGDVWPISIINANADERTGYPTQKPENLVRRPILASSNQGDIVLDAFGGSGTTAAVAEKLGRRWITIDCGKLAVYTIQNRMLALRQEIGNKGSRLKPKAFTLFNAGLYDFSKLRKLPWEDWRFFALQLFQCRDEPHKVGGVGFDGFRQGADVMVFNHFAHNNAVVSEETIQEIHEAIGTRVGSKVFIIAPALTFDFQQDYITHGGVRYYALRIPYSIIHELHRREFTALKQPADELAVNDTVEAVGFDFIRTPELEYELGRVKTKPQSPEQVFIKIKSFRSDAVVREPFQKKGNRETLSMVMLDFNYDEESQVFNLGTVQYADAIEEAGWKVTFHHDLLGQKVMAVFLDIYGNEARILINAEDFKKAGKGVAKRRKTPTKKKAAAKKTKAVKMDVGK